MIQHIPFYFLLHNYQYVVNDNAAKSFIYFCEFMHLNFANSWNKETQKKLLL